MARGAATSRRNCFTTAFSGFPNGFSFYTLPLTSKLVHTSGSMSFGMQPVGTTSAPQSVTVTNTGSGKLNFVKISASPNFFLVTSQCGTSLAAGASCSIAIRFSQTLAGILDGSLTIFDDGLGSPHTVSLAGIGQ